MTEYASTLPDFLGILRNELTRRGEKDYLRAEVDFYFNQYVRIVQELENLIHEEDDSSTKSHRDVYRRVVFIAVDFVLDDPQRDQKRLVAPQVASYLLRPGVLNQLMAGDGSATITRTLRGEYEGMYPEGDEILLPAFVAHKPHLLEPRRDGKYSVDAYFDTKGFNSRDRKCWARFRKELDFSFNRKIAPKSSEGWQRIWMFGFEEPHSDMRLDDDWQFFHTDSSSLDKTLLEAVVEVEFYVPKTGLDTGKVMRAVEVRSFRPVSQEEYLSNHRSLPNPPASLFQYKEER